jgi:tetratricopeptide (TPR) repeat protein
LAEHPSSEELQDFVRGRLPGARSGRVVAHLIRGCALCGARLLPEILVGVAAETPDDPGYDDALDRAFDAQRWHGPAALEVMVKARQALAVLEAGGIAELIETPWGLKGVAACEALLERSWARRHDDPQEMLELANYAAFLSDHLSSERHDPRKLADLRCRAWAALGNAYRVNDDLQSAKWALGRAAELLRQGTGDQRLAAYLLDFQASLSCALRDFPFAFEVLDTVYAIHRRLREDHLAGRALISKGTYTGYANDHDGAVLLLSKGLAMIDRERDPTLTLLTIHNIAWFLMESGRFRKARNMVWEHRWRYDRHGGQIDRVKLRWLQARIDGGLEKLDDAEKGLKEARRGLEKAGLRYHFALAGLDLGSILMRRQSLEEARTVVLDATSVFVDLKIHVEAQKAVLVLKRVFEKSLEAGTFLDQTIRFLRRIEYDPTLTFAAWFRQ